MLVRSAGGCLPRHGGGVTADGGNDEKMQEFPENPGPGQAPGPRTRAQQAGESALAVADIAIGIGGGVVGFARSVFRLGRPLLGPVMSPLSAAARTALPHADRTG